MPNGSHHPQCPRCRHFVTRHLERFGSWGVCGLHDFVVPSTSEVICRDWARPDDTRGGPVVQGPRRSPRLLVYDRAGIDQLREAFAGLEPGVLYRYGYHSAEPPRPLGRFDALDLPVTDVEVLEDAEFGWVVLIDGGRTHFPDEGTEVALLLDNTPVSGRITVAPRPFQRTWHLAREDKTKPPPVVIHDRWMIRVPGAPRAVGEWLDRYVDVAEWLRRRDLSLSAWSGCQVLLRVDRAQERYALFANSIGYDRPR